VPPEAAEARRAQLQMEEARLTAEIERINAQTDAIKSQAQQRRVAAAAASTASNARPLDELLRGSIPQSGPLWPGRSVRLARLRNCHPTSTFMRVLTIVVVALKSLGATTPRKSRDDAARCAPSPPPLRENAVRRQ
jgi:hypothetical protein